MVTTTSASATASRAEPAIATPSAFACSQEAGDEVEADDPVLGLDEIGGHGPAHVAEADEGDGGHAISRPAATVGELRSSFPRPTRPRATITRMISLVPSRIWWTRRSRTIFSMP